MCQSSMETSAIFTIREDDSLCEKQQTLIDKTGNDETVDVHNDNCSNRYGRRFNWTKVFLYFLYLLLFVTFISGMSLMVLSVSRQLKDTENNHYNNSTLATHEGEKQDPNIIMFVSIGIFVGCLLLVVSICIIRCRQKYHKILKTSIPVTYPMIPADSENIGDERPYTTIPLYESQPTCEERRESLPCEEVPENFGFICYLSETKSSRKFCSQNYQVYSLPEDTLDTKAHRLSGNFNENETLNGDTDLYRQYQCDAAMCSDNFKILSGQNCSSFSNSNSLFDTEIKGSGQSSASNMQQQSTELATVGTGTDASSTNCQGTNSPVNVANHFQVNNYFGSNVQEDRGHPSFNSAIQCAPTMVVPSSELLSGVEAFIASEPERMEIIAREINFPQQRRARFQLKPKMITEYLFTKGKMELWDIFLHVIVENGCDIQCVDPIAKWLQTGKFVDIGILLSSRRKNIS